jgi:hypothetical protein
VEEIRGSAQDLLSIVDSSVPEADESNIPPELQGRADTFKQCVIFYLYCCHCINTPAITRELGALLIRLQGYLVEHPFKPDMSVVQQAKIWTRRCGELLGAEAIAKALPEINRQILFSLQKFMVRKVSLIGVNRLHTHKLHS